MQDSPDSHPFTIQSDSDILDPTSLRAIADLAETRGAARFTPGGGVVFDRPLSRDEHRLLPQPNDIPPRFIDLPQDRFRATYAGDPTFAAFVDSYTVAHIKPGYRMVAIPLGHALDAPRLRAIANAAEAFGHGTIRVTADVSIRLPNVPNALLRPLFSTLGKAGLLANGPRRLAA